MAFELFQAFSVLGIYFWGAMSFLAAPYICGVLELEEDCFMEQRSVLAGLCLAGWLIILAFPCWVSNI